MPIINSTTVINNIGYVDWLGLYHVATVVAAVKASLGMYDLG